MRHGDAFCSRPEARIHVVRIDAGSWCLFRPCRAGSREGPIVLGQFAWLGAGAGRHFSAANSCISDYHYDFLNLRRTHAGQVVVAPAAHPQHSGAAHRNRNAELLDNLGPAHA